MAKFSYKEGILPHLGILLTTACNLNGKDCADFIPCRAVTVYKKEEVIQDLDKVLESVDYIEEVLLMGGEVFLYPELDDILDYCKVQKKIRSIILITNGTIIPDTYVLNSLIHKKVMIKISGYNEIVDSRKNKLLEVISSYGIPYQNLDSTMWCHVGKNKLRNWSKKQLFEVFQSCSMSSYAIMNNKGEIFFCARQMAANETNSYPTPSKEYIAIRKLSSEQLRFQWKKFYHLPYLSICNYCDGIRSEWKPIYSCATQFAEHGSFGAVQRIDKEIFLLLLQLMEEWKIEKIENRKSYLFLLEKIINTIQENFSQLECYEETHTILNYMAQIIVRPSISFEEHRYIYQLFRNLIKALSECFQYEVEFRGEFCKRYQKNVIRVLCIDNEDQLAETQADLILTQNDFMQERYLTYPMDYFRYNRIYVQAWFQFSSGIVGIVSGLSYVQYGIVVEQLKYPTANIAVGGMDINYSVQMAEKFINSYPSIRYVIVPISYYEGFYDMNSSTRTFHKLVIGKVILPILADRSAEEEESSIFSSILAIDRLQSDYEEEWKIKLYGKSYFNEFFPRSGHGGVEASDLETNSEEERYLYARKTVRGNESVYKEENKTDILNLLEVFLKKMEEKGISVLFFTPPTTKYVFEAMNPIIEENFYKYYIPFFQQYACCTYIDYYRDKEFSYSDFEDYEHLGESGAHKLTRKINEWIVSVIKS